MTCFLPRSDINTLYQHFFTENETERREASDMMFNQWMPKGGGGGGESALEDEDDDAEMSYEVKVPPGSLRPPIKKGSAANSGLASNNFFLSGFSYLSNPSPLPTNVLFPSSESLVSVSYGELFLGC